MRGLLAQLLAKDSTDLDLSTELPVLVTAYNTSLREKARYVTCTATVEMVHCSYGAAVDSCRMHCASIL